MKSRSAPEPIAVVGMALRVPGATTPERFWRNIRDRIDSLTRPSVEELRAAGVSLQRIMDPRFVRARPLIQDSEYFDAGFFDMSASEAERTDPAHRLFLECVWESLEHAGIMPGRDGPNQRRPSHPRDGAAFRRDQQGEDRVVVSPLGDLRR